MPYAVYRLKVPKKILTDAGILSGNPDKDDMVVDSRFTSRAKCTSKVIEDVHRFVYDKLFINSNLVSEGQINSIDDLNFEIQLSSQILLGLMRDVKLEAVCTIDQKYSETIERAINAVENKDAVLSAARAKSFDKALCAGDVIKQLDKALDMLFDEDMTHRHELIIAKMQMGLIDLYKWL